MPLQINEKAIDYVIELGLLVIRLLYSTAPVGIFVLCY